MVPFQRHWPQNNCCRCRIIGRGGPRRLLDGKAEVDTEAAVLPAANDRSSMPIDLMVIGALIC